MQNNQNRPFPNRTAGPIINTITSCCSTAQEGESHVKLKKLKHQPRGWSTDPSGSKQRACQDNKD